MVNKYTFAYLDKPAEIGEERHKYDGAGVKGRSDDLAQAFPYQVDVVGRDELNGQFDGAGNDVSHFGIFRVVLAKGLAGFHLFKNVHGFAFTFAMQRYYGG